MPLSREQFLLSRNRIHAVLDYLDLHLDDDRLSVDTLAEVSRLSPFHFLRLYTERVKETPMATVRRMRLLRAKEQLLTQPALSVTTAAADAGYASVAAFSRAFVRAFHAPPTRLLAQSNGLASGAHNLPLLEIVSLSAIPVMSQPFTGPAHEVYQFGHEIEWLAKKHGGHGWRHWAVHPDGWVDPLRWPDKWVRMWHCVTLDSLPQRMPGVEKDFLPAGSFARFTYCGKQLMDVPTMIARVSAETAWQVCDGPMMRNPNPYFEKPVPDRLTHVYLPVARQ